MELFHYQILQIIIPLKFLYTLDAYYGKFRFAINCCISRAVFSFSVIFSFTFLCIHITSLLCPSLLHLLTCDLLTSLFVAEYDPEDYASPYSEDLTKTGKTLSNNPWKLFKF